MGTEALESPTTKYTARDMYLRTGLCLLAAGVRSPLLSLIIVLLLCWRCVFFVFADWAGRVQDWGGCRRAVEQFKDLDPQFSVFGECHFLEKLVTAVYACARVILCVLLQYVP